MRKRRRKKKMMMWCDGACNGLVQVARHSSEYAMVEDQMMEHFNGNLLGLYKNHKPKIVTIFRIQNIKRTKAYLVRKESALREGGKEYVVYHGSRSNHPSLIYGDKSVGFDPSKGVSDGRR
jgi:hypothetical protein